jgi:hypothetical protein
MTRSADGHHYVADPDVGDLESVASTLDERSATFAFPFPAVQSVTNAASGMRR